eukprot:9665719-Karenia_brevis.AAC.1
MRRDRSLPAKRSSTDISGEAVPMEEDYTLPCLDPVGSIPQYAIKGDQIKEQHDMMVTNFQKQAPPPNPE